ncbi:MAG: DUF3108 domain-containing protein [Bradymonadaceae bacterium]|nr:DUF3108 domain-containing protein [Lujinxingiaceae bacterium]
MKSSLAIVFALLLLTISSPDARAGELAKSQERFQYAVHYGPAAIGEVSLQVGCPTTSYVAALATAKSYGFAQQIYGFSMRLDSFIDPQSGQVLEGRTHIEEKGVPRNFRSRFSSEPSVAVTRTFRGIERHAAHALPMRGHDLLSWMLDMRRALVWTAGMSKHYIVWDGWKLMRIEARVAERETVWTPHAIFEAYPVKIFRTRLFHQENQGFKAQSPKEELGTAWFSADSARLPVAMNYNAPIGQVRVLLTSVRRAQCTTSASP